MKENGGLLAIDDSDGTDNLGVVSFDEIAMAPVVLECPDAECKLGIGGAKYKTTELEAEMAMRMVELHVKLNHGQGQVIDANNTASRNMRERQKKPTADMEMTRPGGGTLKINGLVTSAPLASVDRMLWTTWFSAYLTPCGWR